MAQTATGHLRLTRIAQSILGNRGEIVHWYPAGEPRTGGGYTVPTFAEPVPIRGVIRPGEIDSNEITMLGGESTADYHLITANAHGVLEDDHLKRPNAAPGSDARLTDDADGFRVSQPMACGVTGLAMFQLDADNRGVDALPTGSEPDSGWPVDRDEVLVASDGFTTPGGG